ncbi:MAG: PucR family transcriptional regulator [Actinomycetales bacterium]
MSATDSDGLTADMSSLLEEVAQRAADDAGLTGEPFAESALLGSFLTDALACATGRRRLDPAELAGCRDCGGRAARVGAASRAVVDLYLSSAWRLWRDGPAVGDPDQPREAALWLLRAADDAVAAMIEGYQEAVAGMVRLEESTRYQIVEALLAGGSAAREAATRAGTLGIHLAGPMVVLAAERRDGFGQNAAASLPPRIERALRGRFSDAVALVMMWDDRLLTIAAAPDRAAADGVVGAVDKALRDVLGAPRDPDGEQVWRVAVSAARAGPAAVRTGYLEAVDVLDLARRVGLDQEVVHGDELAVYRVLLRDREAAWELVESTLSGLLTARHRGEDLLRTVQVYFDTGANATATARQLHLSVRAVTYRLQRVAELTGHDPTDLRERLTLSTAVVVAGLLGWPPPPTE